MRPAGARARASATFQQNNRNRPTRPRREHEYTYFARATTPGSFVVPPPKAEEMYSPETFGRGRSGRFVVEPGE